MWYELRPSTWMPSWQAQKYTNCAWWNICSKKETLRKSVGDYTSFVTAFGPNCPFNPLDDLHTWLTNERARPLCIQKLTVLPAVLDNLTCEHVPMYAISSNMHSSRIWRWTRATSWKIKSKTENVKWISRAGSSRGCWVGDFGHKMVAEA